MARGTKGMPGARRAGTRRARLQELAGIGFLALTFATVISLATHNPGDPSLNSRVDAPARNFLGLFGSYLSDLLVQLFGFGSWLFPLFAFAAAVLCFAGPVWSFSGRLGRLGGLTVFSLSLVSLGNLVFGGGDPFYPAAAPGGATGELLSRLALPLIGSTGSAILFTFLLVAGFTLATHLTPRALGTAAVAGASLLWGRAARGLELRRARREKEERRGRGRRPGVPVDSREHGSRAGDDEEQLPHIGEPEPAEPTIARRPPPPRRRPAPPRRAAAESSAGGFRLPPLELLDDPPPDRAAVPREETAANARILERKLADFGVSGRVTHVAPGPVITMYEYEPAAGVKINRIVGLQDDLALALSATSIRVLAPIPGKSVVGIELPNRVREVVTLKEILLSEEYQRAEGRLAIALGKTISGTAKVEDLVRMPHVLIAGATGSGKSVMINTVVASILFAARPDEVQFIMIDPKMVELTVYDGIPHLIAPVVSNPKKAAYALRNAVGIMEERLRLLSERKVRNIASYNESVLRERAKGGDADTTLMPYLVIVIDELADLMILAQSEVEDSITRLAQLSRAVGMHLVIATQRPSTNVITGIIKANLPVRMSFQVSSKIDSRVILDANGAEQLLGLGDMLYMPPGTSRLERIHGAFVSEEEVMRLVEHLKAQAQPVYDEKILQPPPAEAAEAEGGDGEEDEMYDQAVAVVTESGQASISYVQRRLKVGYNRAARMIEAMERAGVVGPAEGARPRRILARRNYDTEE